MNDFGVAKGQWINQYGDPCTIIRPSGNISTKGRFFVVKRKTDLFSLNFLREGMFTPDSQVQRADLLQNDVTGEQFLVVSYQVKTLGGSITTINTELYMVNYAEINVSRLQRVGDGKGNGTDTWQTIGAAPANVEHINGSEQYKSVVLLPTTVMKITMQASAVTLQLDDRMTIDGVNYQVDDINLTVISGLQVLQLKRDMR